jgi:hypothetical protein
MNQFAQKERKGKAQTKLRYALAEFRTHLRTKEHWIHRGGGEEKYNLDLILELLDINELQLQTLEIEQAKFKLIKRNNENFEWDYEEMSRGIVIFKYSDPNLLDEQIKDTLTSILASMES